MDFVCPKCKGKLNIVGASARCEAGHSFDRARAGYYNLLLGAGGGAHGDNREMVEARSAFLDRGFYAPLAAKVAEVACAHLSAGGLVLDAGCGEGYYTDAVERAIAKRDGGSRVVGFDISRDAVKRAAKRNGSISLAVASSYDMPLGTGEIDLLLNVFSPMAIEETKRVLKVGGVFIFVYPDVEHLFELKAAVYDTPYKNVPKEPALDGFRLLSDEGLEFLMNLDGQEDVLSLFMMTPYAYRTGAAERERLYALESLECRAQFRIAVYERL
ncbi:MAG: methyltransferase domain-containing protein [Clostridia bacterium]|nr:methyltransferase domain-containing protein [Clostridia bacterium]